MSRASLVAVILVASALAAASAQGPPGAQVPGRIPPRDAARQASGTAAIRGRIVTADTGAPIRRAQVRALLAEGRVSRLTSSDAEGRFEFRDLPAGRWELSASKAGFVTLRYGQRRPFEGGRPVEVGDGQAVNGLTLGLPRGAAITGRVFDEFGDPVAGARIQALRYRVVQGTRRLTPTGIADESDDTGAFRLFGLTPGDYYVNALLRAQRVDDPRADASVYAPTYYPGTGSVADAQRVTVSLGQEMSNVSFALLPVRAVRVSGRVIDSTGAPLGGGIVMLAGADTTELPRMFGAPGMRGDIRADGTFTLTNVPPGSYVVNVSTQFLGARGRQRGSEAGAPVEMATVPLTVANEDVSGVTITTTTGGTLAGSIVRAPGSTTTLPAGLQVTAQRPPTGGGLPGVRIAQVGADGTFRLNGLLGPYVLRVGGLPDGWMLESIVVGGQTVTDAPVDVSGAQEVRGARVVLTDRVTEVSGEVTSGGQPAKEYTVVVFPDDPAKWTFPSRYLRSARPDQQGQFKIRALPPDARYLAVAVDYLEDGEGSDPQFLEQMRESASRFSLGAGETKTLGLRLVAR